MNKVGILYHPKIEAAYTTAQKLKTFLAAKGVSTWLCPAWEVAQAKSQLDGTELILSVGGDGTILRAAQVAIVGKTPITGINLGTLGFMTELSTDEAEAKLEALLAGKGWVDERAMLEVELTEPPQVFHALNDAVVARGAIPRLVNVEVQIDGQHWTTYRADGVIVATATGSTGYSLAAGGPILYPQSKDFILVPIVPHLSPAYALVLPSTSVVQLAVKAVHQPGLSIDGHINIPLPERAVISIKLSLNTIRFLRIHPKASFYGSLEQKLRGKKEIVYGWKSQNQGCTPDT